MRRSFQTIAMVLFILAVALLSFFAVQHNRRVGEESAPPVPDEQYVNTGYGFSFSYPPQYRLDEFTSRSIELQDAESGQALAEVSVEVASDTSFATFDDFVEHRAEVSCEGDGPDSTASCPAVTRSDAFHGGAGAAGTVFYLEYDAMQNGATTTREAGPFYAFDISKNVPESPFAALLIYPSHPAEESSLYDEGAALAREIVDSLRLTSRSAP